MSTRSPSPTQHPPPSVRTTALAASRRGLDRNQPFRTQHRMWATITRALLQILSHVQAGARDAELRALGHTPELAYDELTGEWYEVAHEAETQGQGPTTVQDLLGLVSEAREWSATRGEMTGSSRALLAGTALVAALLTGRPVGAAGCAFMSTRDVIGQLAGITERTVQRGARDPRLQAAGLMLQGHAQVTSCGSAAGQARYDGSLVQLHAGGEGQRIHTALAWRAAEHWRPEFGRHIDQNLGAGGALRGATGELTLRTLLRDDSLLWLGLQAAMAALLALDPERYFGWMEELRDMLDLAEMQEAEQRPPGQATPADRALDDVAVAASAPESPQPRMGDPDGGPWGGIEYFEDGLPDIHGWRRRVEAYYASLPE